MSLTANEVFEQGVITRLNGYNEFFNPFIKSDPFYNIWLDGWKTQHEITLFV